MEIEKKELQNEITKMAKGFRDSLDDEFNLNIRVRLYQVISGGDDSRDFKLNPLSKEELSVIEGINTKAHGNEKGDYYVAQIKDFITTIHKNLSEGQNGNVSGIMNRVMENVKLGSVSGNEKTKKSFQYFQDFLQNINK